MRWLQTWEFLALSSARLSLLRCKEALLALSQAEAASTQQEGHPEPVEEAATEAARRNALTAARQLQYSAQIAEAVVHVFRNRHAVIHGKTLGDVDVHHGALLTTLRPVLDAYRAVSTALEDLASRRLNRLQQQFPRAAPPSRVAAARMICLAIVVVGKWARAAAVTLWGIFKHRAADGRALRFFVLGDPEGLNDFGRLVQELRQNIDNADSSSREAISFGLFQFETIDITVSQFLDEYMQRLPRQCSDGLPIVGRALYARMLLHELLPSDVGRCLALDVGDLLVLDDIAELFDFGDQLNEREVLAAASHGGFESLHHAKPSDLNGGVVLYDLRRMRETGFTADTLQAAAFGVSKGYGPNFCVWDQDILNVLHVDVWPKMSDGPKVRALPCRWNLIPSVGWQQNWNSLEFWPAEVADFKRYPGVLFADHVEHHCPSNVELLQIVHGFLSPEQRLRYRYFAISKGASQRYLGEPPSGADPGFTGGAGCACGERAGALHVLSTLKSWPTAQRFFARHAPPGITLPSDEKAFLHRQAQDTTWSGGGFWGGGNKLDVAGMRLQALELARIERHISYYQNCTTVPSMQEGMYAIVPWESPVYVPGSSGTPFVVSVDCGTAPTGASLVFGRVLLGKDGKPYSKGFELALASSHIVLRWGAPHGRLLATYAAPSGGTVHMPVRLQVGAHYESVTVSVPSSPNSKQMPPLIFVQLEAEMSAQLRKIVLEGVQVSVAGEEASWMICSCYPSSVSSTDSEQAASVAALWQQKCGDR